MLDKDKLACAKRVRTSNKEDARFFFGAECKEQGGSNYRGVGGI